MTPDAIKALPRSQVRYACFRQRAGVPDAEHISILNYYIPKIAQYGLQWGDFSEAWDISKDNNLDIVSGHIVRMYSASISSLFNADGSLKAA